MRQSSELRAILSAGSILIDSAPSGTSNLKDVLLSRLVKYRTHSGRRGNVSESNSLVEVELETAQEALDVVERVQQILADSEFQERTPGLPAADLGDSPSIGTRDLAEIRTLLSIVFKWGVDPLLARVASSWPISPANSEPKIIDLTSTPEDYQLLSALASQLMAILFPGGVQGSLPQTHITTTMLNKHMADLLRPCMALGWLPKSLANESMPTLDSIRPLVIRSLAILPPSQAISTLGSILAGPPQPPLYVHKSCASLLSKQLLRPDGIYGFCTAVFGEEEASLEKLEHIARVLSAVPTSLKPEEYFHIVVPRILMLLSHTVPPAHRRAAAFALSRMLAADGSFRHQTVVSNIIFSILHGSFLDAVPLPKDGDSQEIPTTMSSSPTIHEALTPTVALSTLTTLLTNTDPSPIIISTFLSPIVPALYTLLFHLDHVKTSDPGLTESVRGHLETWGRVVSTREGIQILWNILDGEGGEWAIDLERNPKRVKSSDQSPSLSLITPEDLRRAEDTIERDVDLNLLNLRPDPIHFVHFIKSINRADLSAELFVKLLEAYGETKATGDPRRTLLYLQLVIQMQAQLSETNSPSNILSRPEHLLSFVKHTLESAVATPPNLTLDQEHEARDGSWLENLRIVPEDDQPSDGHDSDDEGSDTTGSGNDEITNTALNLLLSILEANPNLSGRTTSVLDDIFSLLEPLANDISHPGRSLAREARMVLTARLASTSSSQRSFSKKAEEEDLQEIYQKALKLLQDPILPVRAHGLLLLRQLVSPRPSTDARLDDALLPAILSIFLQSIQDDDSYIFLNAVQGLAAMVETFGQEVLKGLVKTYSEGLHGIHSTNLTQNEVDKRIRIGEALGQIIRKCGDALGIYVDIIVPPLFIMIGSSQAPTTLRTSAISLLAECENTSSLALLRYSTDLFETMLDLLQLETVSATDVPKRPGDEAEEADPITMDSHPLSTNSKFPPLRRAALHFLSLLIRATTTQIYDSTFQGLVFPLERASTILGFAAATDKDVVVRVMAQEALEGLRNMRRAMAGI